LDDWNTNNAAMVTISAFNVFIVFFLMFIPG
jgi:hypothetical protein